MSLQFENPECGHMETDDAPCTCYKDDNGTRTCRSCRDGLHIERDPLAWMDEVGHTNERTKHEREWIAAMRKRHADVTTEGGTGEYVMWLEERLYTLEARR